MARTEASIDEARRILTWNGAQEVLGRAAQQAGILKIPVCVAVVDRYGWLLAFARIGDAPLMSIHLAQDKAFSVAAFAGRPTHDWPQALNGDPVLTAGLSKMDRFSAIGGGVPIMRGRQLIGAVGVSGGTVEQDRAVAEAGALIVMALPSAAVAPMPPARRQARPAGA